MEASSLQIFGVCSTSSTSIRRRRIGEDKPSILRVTTYLAHQGGVREILELDESCISNPEIRNRKLDRGGHCQSNLPFRISGFEMQDSSNFKIFLPNLVNVTETQSGFMKGYR